MRITDWPSEDKPREKLLEMGASALTDAELLAIFLRTGTQGMNVVELARHLLINFGGLRQLLKANQGEFCCAKGLGKAKYAQLQAVLEMANRCHLERMTREGVFNNADDTKQFLLQKLRDEPHEIFAMLLLDSQHRLLKYEHLFHGTIDSASVYPRVLVKRALDEHAAAVILAHNFSGLQNSYQCTTH